jgi:hypothetical protein
VGFDAWEDGTTAEDEAGKRSQVFGITRQQVEAAAQFLLGQAPRAGVFSSCGLAAPPEGFEVLDFTPAAE